MSAGQSGDSSPVPPVPMGHPLTYRWVFYHMMFDRERSWEECLMPVATFDTVEDFWRIYNHIQKPSSLHPGSDYYIFKEGIRPMWEDPRNINGGRWLLNVEQGSEKECNVDFYWLETLMLMLGEQFESYGSYVCGAVVNVRSKGDKVSLWTFDAMRDDANLKIGRIMQSTLQLNDRQRMKYEKHTDTSKRSGSTVKPRIVLQGKTETVNDGQRTKGQETNASTPSTPTLAK
ncbi:unnamed protein product, partial [Mesorhabditis spiculigera]